MHDCPECGQTCDCDGEDIWNAYAALDCAHDCDEHDDGDEGPRGFYTVTPAGHVAHIHGDPNMSGETLDALHHMLDLAVRQFTKNA